MVCSPETVEPIWRALSKYDLQTFLASTKVSQRFFLATKCRIFAFTKDRVWKSLLGWKDRFFSIEAKEVLIKSVARAIPTYAMSLLSTSQRFMLSNC